MPVDIALRHEVLNKGQADVSIVFTTDPQIKRDGLRAARGRQGDVPAVQLDVRGANDVTSRRRAPTSRRRSTTVQKGLTDEVMQELNARVDLDKKTPEEVAGEYLKESGLTG